jgi:hypothetical protein
MGWARDGRRRSSQGLVSPLSGFITAPQAAPTRDSGGDDGDPAHVPAAAGTGLDVDREGPLEQFRPRSIARAARARRGRGVGRRGARRGSVVSGLARPWREHHQGSPLGSGGEDTEVTGKYPLHAAV